MNSIAHELCSHIEIHLHRLKETYEGVSKTLEYSGLPTHLFPKQQTNCSPLLSSKTCSSINIKYTMCFALFRERCYANITCVVF